jgi:hypothetical protein
MDTNEKANAGHVEELVKKATEAKTSQEAMHLSQAALNCANALAVMKNSNKA